MHATAPRRHFLLRRLAAGPDLLVLGGRLVLGGLLVLLALLAGTPARADGERALLVVLDRGAGAESSAEGDAGNALRILGQAARQGRPATLLALGRSAKGRVVSTQVEPDAAGLQALAEDENYAFRGDSDARVALQRAQAAHKGSEPMDVVLLGPFAEAPAEDEGEDAAAEATEKEAKAEAARAALVAAWNEKAPAGSRVLPIGISNEALETLQGTEGLASTGFLVPGMEAPRLSIFPFSPLRHPPAAPAPLVAEAQVLVDVLRLGTATEIPPLLEMLSDVKEDRITTTMLEGRHTFHLERAQGDGRIAALRFRPAPTQSVIWLCDVPETLSFRWEALEPDAQLVGPNDETPPTFAAIDVEVGAPYASAFRVRRSRVGPTPAWRASFPDGAAPEGLRVEIGDETRVSDEIAETEVRVSLTARPATPLQAKGRIAIRADGWEQDLLLPFEVRVRPGVARLVVVAQPHALPRAATDAPSTLEVRAVNANTPASLRVQATSAGNQSSWLAALLEAPDGTQRQVPLSEPFAVEVGVLYKLRLARLPAAPTDLDWPAELTLSLVPTPGVEIDDRQVAPPLGVRVRRPRLVQVGRTPRYDVVDGTVSATGALRLRLDPDGADGDTALAWMQTEPRLRVAGDTPIGWKTVGSGPGEWTIVPAGTWSGPPPGIFEPKTLTIALQIEWPVGDAPGPFDLSMQIAPKWGGKGFLLIGLAGAAVLLGISVMFLMRSAPVRGTLIYTVDGLEGTVGRLDLAPVGRRTSAVTADERGRLSWARRVRRSCASAPPGSAACSKSSPGTVPPSAACWSTGSPCVRVATFCATCPEKLGRRRRHRSRYRICWARSTTSRRDASPRWAPEGRTRESRAVVRRALRGQTRAARATRRRPPPAPASLPPRCRPRARRPAGQPTRWRARRLPPVRAPQAGSGRRGHVDPGSTSAVPRPGCRA
jgi:hypothetical protein